MRLNWSNMLSGRNVSSVYLRRRQRAAVLRHAHPRGEGAGGRGGDQAGGRVRKARRGRRLRQARTLRCGWRCPRRAPWPGPAGPAAAPAGAPGPCAAGTQGHGLLLLVVAATACGGKGCVWGEQAEDGPPGRRHAGWPGPCSQQEPRWGAGLARAPAVCAGKHGSCPTAPGALWQGARAAQCCNSASGPPTLSVSKVRIAMHR
jgi:hypothetical protein